MTSKFVLAIVLACMLHNIEAYSVSKGDRAQGRNIRSTNREEGLRETVFEELDKINEDAGLSNLYEGDIAGVGYRSKRAAIKFGIKDYSYWPNCKVLYTFDVNFPANGITIVRDAMKRIESVTCVQFLESEDVSAGRIRIFDGQGCYSHVGYKSGVTRDVSLGVGCLQKTIILHELMHVLGFWHEQSRTDRDENVLIMWDNIIEGKEYNFNRRSIEHSQSFTKYDIGSILHYGKLAFSKNGRPTIVSKADVGQELGQVNDLSKLDIEGVNIAYRCTAPVNGQWSEWSQFTSCSKSCGIGTSFRLRFCSNPVPRNGGSNCLGDSQEIRKCNVGECPSFSCNFDEGLCKWYSKKGENTENTLTWARRKDGTPSGGTGPSNDHTSTKGHYVYMETSSPAKGTHHALLRSEIIPSGKYKCLSVWIHMYGKGMGTLEIAQRNTITKEAKVLRSYAGNHGNVWVQRKIPIDDSFDSEIDFKGIRANSWQGDMAFDDIQLSEESCEPAPYSCDFEGWQCNWSVTTNKNYAWKRHTGATPSSSTGPTNAQSGAGYMYTEASTPATKGDIASLETMEIPAARSARRCLTYNYNMYGNGIGKLRIYAIGKWGGTHLLNSYEGEQGLGWKLAKISFQSWEGVKIKFEAERGSSYLGDIAIDNVNITNQNCM